jgi:hypothetical protein
MLGLGGATFLSASAGVGSFQKGLIDVWSYPAETEIPHFRSHVVCAKCGSRGNKIDLHPNWSFVPSRPLDYAE